MGPISYISIEKCGISEFSTLNQVCINAYTTEYDDKFHNDKAMNLYTNILKIFICPLGADILNIDVNMSPGSLNKTYRWQVAYENNLLLRWLKKLTHVNPRQREKERETEREREREREREPQRKQQRQPKQQKQQKKEEQNSGNDMKQRKCFGNMCIV